MGMMYKSFMIAVLAPFAQLHCSKKDNKDDSVKCTVDNATKKKTDKEKHGADISEAFCNKYFDASGFACGGPTTGCTNFGKTATTEKLKCDKKESTNAQSECEKR